MTVNPEILAEIGLQSCLHIASVHKNSQMLAPSKKGDSPLDLRLFLCSLAKNVHFWIHFLLDKPAKARIDRAITWDSHKLFNSKSRISKGPVCFYTTAPLLSVNLPFLLHDKTG